VIEPRERGNAVTRFLRNLDDLYNGTSRRSVRYRYGLLVFDLTMILFIVVSSFMHGMPVIEALDHVFGVLVLLDFVARMTVSRSRWADLLHPAGVADVIVVVSLLAPAVGENLAFLRVARSLRLLRSYQLINRLKRDFAYFRRHEYVVQACINLLVFLFVMTAIVFETQSGRNPSIQNYADALYFTVTTLTTTGYGDITLPGTTGRLISVLIMIFGVSLFIRLIQVLFRPPRLSWRCTGCGLTRHEPDAIHCRHCGTLLKIPHGDREY
jgi:voltage-gated potassium channel